MTDLQKDQKIFDFHQVLPKISKSSLFLKNYLKNEKIPLMNLVLESSDIPINRFSKGSGEVLLSLYI